MLRIQSIIKWIIITFGGFAVLIIILRIILRRRPAIPPPTRPSTSSADEITRSDRLQNGDMDLPVYPPAKLPRKIICSTRGLICTSGEGENLHLIDSGVDFLISVLRAASASDSRPKGSFSLLSSRSTRQKTQLFLITQCQEDETEQRLVDLLKSRGVINMGLDENTILFCSTAEGRAHMARQLEPDLLIDTVPSVAEKICPFIPQVALVASEQYSNEELFLVSSKFDNLFFFNSLRDLMATYSQQ